MTPRTATFVAALAVVGIATAGCGGGSDPSASGPASSSLTAGSSAHLTGPGVSVAPSNVPPAAGTGSAGTATPPGASGSSGGTGAPVLPTPAGNTGLGSLPEGFPLPPGTTLGRIAVRATDITAPLEVPDGAQAATFWKRELPAAGYKTTSFKVTKAIGDIKFSGNGCKSGSDLQISGEHVAFYCRR
jgi:hypothetical protein